MRPTRILVRVRSAGANSVSKAKSGVISSSLHKKATGLLEPAARTRESSPGHGNLVFAMRVDKKLTRQAYNTDPRFHKKKPLISTSYARQRGDNLRPASTFERHNQFALISWHFYYFGGNAVTIPKELSDVEKSGPGFKSRFATVFILRFIRWLETNYKPGKHGEPCERKLNGCGRRKPGC